MEGIEAMSATHSQLLSYLKEQVEHIVQEWPDVSTKRMFGCDAFFRGDTIFALIWKTGRIGVKLPETSAFHQLMAMPGAAPWQAGNKVMSSWVLVPEEFHDDPKALAQWVSRAGELALAAPTKKTARTKPPAKPRTRVKTTRKT
jgi:TfoX/Sxy family transcriptional regulator of competence genes